MSTVSKDYFEALLERARQAPATAKELLASAAAEHPSDPRPLVVLAAELVEGGQLDAAEAAYLTALQRAPGLAIARFQLGLLQLTSGRPASALATWGPLEELGEREPLCLFKRGLEAVTLDRADEGRRWILAGIEANQVNEPLNRDMRKLLERLVGVQGRETAAPPTPEATAAPTAEQNFFLSGYGKRG